MIVQRGEEWIWIVITGETKATGRLQVRLCLLVQAPVPFPGEYILTQTRWRPREPRAANCLVPTTRVWSQLRYNNERAMGRLNHRNRVLLGELGAAMCPRTSDRMVRKWGHGDMVTWGHEDMRT